MLDLLKKAHATTINVPKRKVMQPDRELLAVRFDAFQSAASGDAGLVADATEAVAS